jgi:predicted nucleic acid-binding protein
MAYLIDTPLLLRLANLSDVQYPVADHAIRELHRQGETLHIAPQNLIEFRNAATRPVADNGLGFSVALVEQQAAGFEALFSLLPDTPDIYPAWKTLVSAAGIIGKQVHDARLVAVCQVYGITHVLTFNVRHFARFTGLISGLVIVDPATI